MKRFLPLLFVSVLLWGCGGSGDDPVGPDIKPTPTTPDAEKIAVGSVFPAWAEGYLDIHSINGGRGEGFYYIFPDGTTMLCDAAGAPPVEIANNGGTASRPSRSIGSGTVIAHYIQHFAPAVANGKVDYFITSHYHGDHIGAYRASWDSYGWTPYDKNGQAVSTLNMEAGGFYRNGVAEVGMIVPFAKVLDRGDWADPPSGDYVDDGGQKRYLLYVNYLDYAARTQGTVRETLRVGRSDQIVQTKDPNKYKTFSVRTVAAGGKIWTGSGTDVNTSYVPSSSEILNRIKSGLGVNENIWSSVLLVSYGKFDWFTGGDIQYTGMSSTSWFDIETPISKALHKVEAMKACHHSTANTNSSNLLNVLKPDVYIASTWQTVQPNPATIKRVLAANANTRIYTTNLDASNIATLKDGGVDPSKFIATSGHVVIRVNASGKYWIAVLDDTNEKYLVKSVSGPFTSN